LFEVPKIREFRRKNNPLKIFKKVKILKDKR